MKTIIRYAVILCMAGLAALGVVVPMATANAATSPPALGPVAHPYGVAVPSPTAKPALVITLPTAGPNDSIGPSKIYCYNSPITSSASHMYVTEEDGDHGNMQYALRARSTVSESWQQFLVCYNEDSGVWYLRSRANGRWVAEEQAFTGSLKYLLRARSTNPVSWESFDIQCVSGGIAIQSWENGLYVTTEMAGYSGGEQYVMRARSPVIQAWQIFRLVNPNVLKCIWAGPVHGTSSPVANKPVVSVAQVGKAEPTLALAA